MTETKKLQFILYVSSRYSRVLTDYNFLQGNLDERVTDAIIWELMLQAGPVGMSSSIGYVLLWLTL